MPSPITAQTIDEVYEAITAAFRTDMLSTQPLVQLAWENVKFDPDEKFPSPIETDAWVRFNMQHTPGEAGNASLGNRYFRRTGVIIVQCFTRADTGRVRSNAVVDSVLLFFEQTSVPGTWFRGQSPSEAGDDGSWFQVNVSADFTYDTLRA
jgi:hypothetical protein